MKPYILSFFLALTVLISPFRSNAQAPTEQLIVFVDAKQQSEFTKKIVDSLQIYTNLQNIPIKIIDIAEGAPAEVSFTPYVVYQNHRGRSAYKGRINSFQRILNFVRTVRLSPQSIENASKKDAYVWQDGRSKVLFSIKITDATGPKNSSSEGQEAFKKMALKAIEKSFSKIKKQASLDYINSSWTFYFDFYPYVDAQGKLYVSTAIYSGYDCIEPICTRYQNVAQGPLKKAPKVFAEATKDLEAAWHAQRTSSEKGDAIYSISNNIPVKSWEELGLALPIPPASSKTDINLDKILPNGKFPSKWLYAGPIDAASPALSFSFPAPLTQYAGEVKNIVGSMELTQENSLAGSKAEFEVEVTSMTMGMEDLDHHVHEGMLLVDKFPIAKFTFKKVESEKLLKFGELIPFKVEAILNMKGIEVPIVAQAQAEPSIDEEGSLLLLINASFQLEGLQKQFGLELPAGPADANNRLIFNLNFKLKHNSH